MESLSGLIAIVTIRVEAAQRSADPVPGRPLRKDALRLELAEPIRDELQAFLTNLLREGPLAHCYVDRPALREGSIEILTVIAGVGIALKSVNELADELDKLTERARRYASVWFTGVTRADTLVWGSWEPGAALKQATGGPSPHAQEESPVVHSPTVPPPRSAESLAWSRVLLAYLGLASVTAVALTLIIRLT